MTEYWVQTYSNQKEIKYVSHSNIIASVEAKQFTTILSPFHPRHFVDLPPPSFSSICDTRISNKIDLLCVLPMSTYVNIKLPFGLRKSIHFLILRWTRN